MTKTTLPDEVLKTDVLGRVKTPPERRAALREEFERSGVSGKKFPALVGVNYQTLASWVQKRQKARGQYPSGAKKPAVMRGPEALRLIAAVIEGGGVREEDACAGPMCVQWPGGARVEVHDARQAALAGEWWRAFERPRSC